MSLSSINYITRCEQAAKKYGFHIRSAFANLQGKELCDRVGRCYSEFKIECQIPDDHTKLAKLGGGTFGDVFLHPSEDESGPFVVKVINPIEKNLPSPYNFSELEDYASEFSVLLKLKRVNNPFFPKLLSAVKRQPCECLDHHYPYEILGIMTKADGATIEQHVQAGQLLNSVENITCFARQIIEAQLFLINNLQLLHADLNPTNLFWDENKKKMTMIDFGKMTSLEADVRILNNLCAIAVRPPEAYLDQEDLSIEKGLLFSIGCITYFFTTGEKIVDFRNFPKLSDNMDAYFQKKLLGKVQRHQQWLKNVPLWSAVVNERCAQLDMPFNEEKDCLNFMSQLLHYDPNQRFVSHHIALQHPFVHPEVNNPKKNDHENVAPNQDQMPNKKLRH